METIAPSASREKASGCGAASGREKTHLPRAGLAERLIAGYISACATAALALGTWVRPDPRGFGSHEQLYHIPCGFRAAFGIPCPTCGMTTSFAYMMRLEVVKAFFAQPFGILVFGITVGAALGGAVVLVSGISARRRLERLPWLKLLSAAGLLLAASWLVEILFTLYGLT